MATKGDATAATASGDTTRTSLGTITLAAGGPVTVQSVWCNPFGGALLTSAEAISGIFELSSNNLSGAQIFPTGTIQTLTSGVGAINQQLIPYSAQLPGASSVEFFITLDDAQTGALTARGGIIYDA